jgi:hypothetical protein
MGRKSRETVPLTERMEKYESVESVNPEWILSFLLH